MLKYFLEIQNKFILIIITIFSSSFTCYYYKNVLLFLVTQMHINDAKLYFIFTDVTELFSVHIKIIIFFLTQIIVWQIFYHIFSFLGMALYSQEFKFASFLFYSVTLFWVLSSVLSGYVLVPCGWNFFLSFHLQQGVFFEARLSEYFNFYRDVYILCLSYCQLFLVLFIFLVDIQQNYLYIKKYRKFYYYLFLLFSTLLTPPDLVSQIVITLLVIAVYEIILLFSIFKFLIQKFS